jgi:hypothetical protein
VAPRSFAVDGVRIDFVLPSDWQVRKAKPVAVVTGLRTILQRAYDSPSGGWADLVCVRSASVQWLPGAEQDVLHAAMARTTARHQLRDLGAVRIREQGGLFVMPFSGFTRGSDVGAAALQVYGVHQLGFRAADGSPLFCSLTCGGSPLCVGLGEQLRLQGVLAEAPAPGLWFEWLVTAARHPLISAGALFALLAAITTLLLRRRRRPAER